MHSGWFVDWFDSSHYLARAGMKITWPHDPIACWEMAKSYMQDGQDRFGNNQITRYVCTKFLLHSRFIVLVRLYKLAHVLDLFGLMDRAYAVLVEMEHLISPPNVLTLARYIFGGKEHCGNILCLRKLCLKWIGKHYDWLLNSKQWGKVLEDAVPELGKQWMRIIDMKKRISQEELRNAIQRNLSEANVIINALKAVDAEPDAPTQADSGNNGDSSRRTISPEGDYAFTKLERSRAGTPTETHVTIKDGNGPMKHPTYSPTDSDGSGHDFNSNNETDPTVSVSLSIEGSSEGGDASNVNNAFTNEERPSIFETSSIPGECGPETKQDITFRYKMEAQKETPALDNDLKGRVVRPFPYSVSEPLLTTRRGVHAYKEADNSIVHHVEHPDRSLASAIGNNERYTDQQGNVYPPLQHGVILTTQALRQLDGWPLSDVPLRDPLLPVPVAHPAPSSDLAGDKHLQSNATTPHAQAVTVFGLHRPGMGGSVIVPVNEEAPRSESRAGAANAAKAREFLGINEPSPVARGGARSSMDVEPRKLRKMGMWIA